MAAIRCRTLLLLITYVKLAPLPRVARISWKNLKNSSSFGVWRILPLSWPRPKRDPGGVRFQADGYGAIRRKHL
jgi:hypothetical protein